MTTHAAPGLAHPGHVFLALAGLALFRFERGEQDIEDALDGLIPAFERLRPCPCFADTIGRLGEPPIWTTTKPKPEPSAAAFTVEAVMYQLRTGGMKALNQANCRQRLAELSKKQRKTVLARLTKMQSQYPRITAELLDFIKEFANAK